MREDDKATVIDAYAYKYFATEGVELVQHVGDEFSTINHLNPVIMLKGGKFVGMIMPLNI